MGPFVKVTSKLKNQQKDALKNGRHGTDVKGEPHEQHRTLPCFGSKIEDDVNTLEHFGPVTGLTGHTRIDEKREQPLTLVKQEACQFAEKDKGTRPPDMEAAEYPVLVLSEQGGAGYAISKKSWRDGNQGLDVPKSLDALACITSCKLRSEGKPGEGGENSVTVPAVLQEAEGVCETGDLDSSSLSLSLGLNRIKTRSGPLCGDGKGAELNHFLSTRDLSRDSKAISTGEGSGEAICQRSFSRDFAPGDTEIRNFEALVGNWEDKFHKSGLHGDSHKSQLKNRQRAKGCESQRLQRGSSGLNPSTQSVIPTFGKVYDSNNHSFFSGNERAVGAKFMPTVPKVLSKSDHYLEKKVPSSLISYLNHELQENAGIEVNVKQLAVIKEGESPSFSQPEPLLNHKRIIKKWPKDIKSFSHELGPRGGRPHDVHRPHSDNDLEEILAALRARFNTAKGEVDAELKFFAADLIEILERNADSFPGWRENVEDLLVIAQRCTKLSPVDFRRECEHIVHGLDERRQELPMGLLKQLYTRTLFILTRCTRLLQFQKETIPEEEGLHRVRQCLKCVPSVDRTLPTGLSKRGKVTSASRKLLSEVLEHSARSDAGIPMIKGAKKHKSSLEKQKHHQPSPIKDFQSNLNHLVSLTKISSNIESSESRDAGKRLGIGSEENFTSPLQVPWDQGEENSLEENSQQGSCPFKDLRQESWPHWPGTEKEEAEFVICRICEEEILTSHLEPHSLRCSWADACDCQGVNLDEKLKMLADYLEKIAELSTPKCNQMATDDSPDGFKPAKGNSFDAADIASLQPNDISGRFLDGRMDDVCVSDSVSMEDLRGLSLINFKRLLGLKADHSMASSSAGSGTPRSTLTTPRTSQLDLLWAERNSFVEQEDTSQIYQLASVAREVACKHYTEDGVLDFLGARLEELHEFLRRNKITDLTVDTFGKRIEKLLREKIYLFSSMGDGEKSDSFSGSFEDDCVSTDDGIQSLKSTSTHCSYKIRIEDFDILKLISRGAFGRVFLAKKRATGDNFAIKVLRKIDMIRKNAVENILAERDILISVCNPFVVRFFYSFACRDNLYLVMEYLIGGDLYSLLRKLGCLEENFARVYIAELVLALEYLHSLGVVHRDLKPDNILIAHDGHIKLTDFGLSKVGLINSTDDLSGPTSGGIMMEENMFENSLEHEHGMQPEYRTERSAVGTPDYLAPEILLGTEHGYTADWWSVGVILFELITGLPPFNAEHSQIIFDNILNRKIPWPRVPEEMSEDARDFIDKLLIEDPNQRLGAKGAAEVKNHTFFKDISWDNLARQKAAFVPSPENVDDTSYFTCRHHEVSVNSSPRFGDSSDCSTTCSSSNSMKAMLNEGEDDCGELQELERSSSVERTFNNFSFKNASQLAYMNYDILSQAGRDVAQGHSRHQSAS